MGWRERRHWRPRRSSAKPKRPEFCKAPTIFQKKQPVCFVGLAARQRVAVRQERRVEFGPFVGAQHRLGQRQDLGFLD